MLSKSSKWELGFVHYIAKFTTSRFLITRFECIYAWWGEIVSFIFRPDRYNMQLD